SRLVVAAPLRVEAWAAGRSALPSDAVVVRTGMGLDAARRSLGALRRQRPDAMAVIGLAGGLGPGVLPGHVVVADEVRTGDGTVTARCPSAPLLAGELRRHGLTVHVGPIVSVARLAHGTARTELAKTGAIAVDMESAELAGGLSGGPTAVKAGNQSSLPLAVVRVIVDTAEQPLGRFGMLRRGVAGLQALTK
nr:hypothetical protein [Micromonospora sp. DSM 115978]